MVMLCEETVTAECTCPMFCGNCGKTEHAASRCRNVAVHGHLAYRLWAEPLPLHESASDQGMVMMLRPAETAHIATPLTVTCGKIQIQAKPEPNNS